MMTLWRSPTFANEEALDWLADLLDESDPYFINNTLKIIIDYPPDEKPEVWDCGCALAAAEILAAARGNPPAKFPMAASKWLDANGVQPDDEALDLARQALSRIEESSALKDELAANECLPQLTSDVHDLRKRLGLQR